MKGLILLYIYALSKQGKLNYNSFIKATHVFCFTL